MKPNKNSTKMSTIPLNEQKCRKRASWESERLSRRKTVMREEFSFFMHSAMPDNCIDMGGREFSLFSIALIREYQSMFD